MKKLCLVLAVWMISFSCGNKSAEEIMKMQAELSAHASINKEIKKLKKAFYEAKTDKEKSQNLSKQSLIYIEKGDFVASMKTAYESVMFQPNDFMNRYLLGKSYIQAGRYEDAVDELQKSINYNDKFAPSHYELGNAYYKMYKYVLSMGSYKKAVELKPKHYRAYNNMAVVSNILKDYKSSEKFFLKVVEIEPNFFPAYKNLGVLYEINLKKKADAVKYYKIYLKKYPGTPYRLKVLNWIQYLGGTI